MTYNTEQQTLVYLALVEFRANHEQARRQMLAWADDETLGAEARAKSRANAEASRQFVARADELLALERPCNTAPIAKPTRDELLEAGGAIAECLEFALETHIYEPGEVPPDSGELLALEAWRRVTAPAAAAELELTVAPQPVPIGPPDYEEEPEAERSGAYRVRFYNQTTTTDRHSIVVRASSPEAARARVEAWGTGKIELTEAEELTDELEREEGIDASEFSQLEEEGDRYAVVELEAAELA